MKLTPTLSLIAALSLTSVTFAHAVGMGGMDDKQPSKAARAMVYKADAVVKRVDVAQGTVAVTMGPVKSLAWPAMSMDFAVRDKSLFDKLGVGKQVHVEFKKEGSAYVITAVE